MSLKRCAKRKEKEARARKEQSRRPRFIACHYVMDQDRTKTPGCFRDAFECAQGPQPMGAATLPPP